METDVGLDRAWRAEVTDEPSAGVDAAIRAAARRAVGAGPRPAHTPFSARWRVPLSLAAVVVVSVTVTLFIAERREHLPRESAPLSSPGAQPAPPPSADPVSPAMPAVPSAPPAEAQAARAGAHRPAASPPTDYRDDASKDAAANSVEQGEADAREQGPSGRVAEKEALPNRPPAAPPASPKQTPAGAPAMLTEEAAEPAAKSRADAGGVGQVAGVPAPDRGQADERVAADEGLESTPAAAGPDGTRRRSAASPGMRPQSAAPRPVDEASQPELLRAEAARDPQAWIGEIRELHRAGKRAQAQRALEEFRRRYPDHALPDDLLSLLPPGSD
jgi:hypothetical protein